MGHDLCQAQRSGKAVALGGGDAQAPDGRRPGQRDTGVRDQHGVGDRVGYGHGALVPGSTDSGANWNTPSETRATAGTGVTPQGRHPSSSAEHQGRPSFWPGAGHRRGTPLSD